MGTTYERYILHRLFENIRKKYAINNILEVPSFGMTGISGINSMWWALNGVEVTVVDDNEIRAKAIQDTWQEARLRANVVYLPQNEYVLPFENKTFDLSWNFAALWHVQKIDLLLKEMKRNTKKVILICVPNRENIGYLMLAAERKKKSLFADNIKPRIIKNIMSNLKWRLAEDGYFDVPPWPDIAMKKEELLEKIGLSWLARRYQRAEAKRWCILDYYNGKNEGLEKDIMKYSYLEDLPQPIKRMWAHHRYFLFTPDISN